MNHLERRIERAETSLGLGKSEIIVIIVWFGSEPLPPEKRCGSFIIRHIPYERRGHIENPSTPGRRN